MDIKTTTMPEPLQQLYQALVDNNYDVPDNYESFRNALTQKGEEGSIARMQLYQSLKDDDFDVPDTYDSFANRLFVPVGDVQQAQQGQQPQQQKSKAQVTFGTPSMTIAPDNGLYKTAQNNLTSLLYVLKVGLEPHK